jgi:signal transduction histidine kinase/HAMP domain-containing protein
MPKHLLKRQSISTTIAIITFLGGTLFAFIIAGTAYKINHAVESKALFWSYLKLSLILTAFAMAILYWILRKVVTRPLRQLIQASERLGGGELGVQVPETSSYEIGRLTGAFNQMSVSLASQQSALKTSEERYLQIFHFFPLPLILMDNRGQMINVNSVYFSQAKKNPYYLKEWEGKSVLDLPLIQKGKIQPEIHQLLEQGDSFKLSKISISLNETLSPGIFNISGIPLFDTPARLNAAILEIEDITLQQNLENQLIQSQKMESLEILSGGIAHDFNNILTGILGYSQLLREQLPPDDFNQKALKAIEKSSLRARDLIQQMIGFARWHPLAKSRVEVNSLVAGIVALVQKTLDREIQIQAVLVKEPCFILVDADQLHQALLNLCINARDAIQTEGGKILLKTERKTIEEGLSGESGEKEFVDIIVQDNGIGMESDVLAHIFEPFYTTKEVGKGSGLGLSVTYGIVKANDGEINVHSEPGKETTFTLRFSLIDQQGVENPPLSP